MKKLVLTVNINNFAPEITRLTYPLLRRYAHKVGAEFRVISERKFPEWPIEVEKLQAYELGQGYDWIYVIDSDAVIHPDMIDPTFFMAFDTVAHNGNDHSVSRWTSNEYLLRDGRGISSCNWFSIASGWCLDFWHPPDWTTPDKARAAIHAAVSEINSEVFDEVHLTDDYLMSCNIARYGLKFTTIDAIRKKHLLIPQRDAEGRETGQMVPMGPWLWHAYVIPKDAKEQETKKVLRTWQIDRYVDQLRGEYGALYETPSEVSSEQGLSFVGISEGKNGGGTSR